MEHSQRYVGDLSPFAEFLMVELSMWTFLTVLSLRPPTEPIDKPCPPLQRPPVKLIFYQLVVS